MSQVELISLTPDAEKTMAYIARVSNPKNQENEDYSKLLSYCIKNEHWSVFEQSFMTLQIETNRGIAAHYKADSELYEDLLAEGIAKECARFVLPLATPTRIYMSGSCRSWIHYIHLRSAHGTQKEHKSIAQNCKSIFKKSFPIVSKSLEW